MRAVLLPGRPAVAVVFFLASVGIWSWDFQETRAALTVQKEWGPDLMFQGTGGALARSPYGRREETFLRVDRGPWRWTFGKSHVTGLGAEWLDAEEGLWLTSAAWSSPLQIWNLEAAFVPWAPPDSVFAPVNFEAFARGSWLSRPWKVSAWMGTNRDREEAERLIQGGARLDLFWESLTLSTNQALRSTIRWVQDWRLQWENASWGFTGGVVGTVDHGRPRGGPWEQSLAADGQVMVPGSAVVLGSTVRTNLTARDARGSFQLGWHDPAGWFVDGSVMIYTTFRDSGDPDRARGPWGNDQIINKDHFTLTVGCKL